MSLRTELIKLAHSQPAIRSHVLPLLKKAYEGGLHEDPADIVEETMSLHRAILSVVEELQAVDWYAQRADACDDKDLKAIILHNLKEEVEHAAMTLEWLRRNDDRFGEAFETYLFSEGAITDVEEKAT